MTDKTIRLTVDLFLRNWSDPEDVLWVCLQPHVMREALGDWIRESGDLSGWDYRFVDSATESEQFTYVPVPFGDKENVTLTLTGDGSIVRRNDRRDDVMIENPRAFAAANRQPVDEAAGLQGEGIIHVDSAPFAEAYNLALRAALESGTSEDELAAMLQLAFWGGARRRVPKDAVKFADGVDIMDLDDGDDARVTNLHSLAGLMFEAGSFGERQSLSRHTHIKFEVHRDGLNGSKEEKPLRKLMAGLQDELPLARDVHLKWSSDLDRVAYLKDNGTAFVQQGDGASRWYARNRVPGEGRKYSPFRLPQLSRLIVIPHKPPDGSDAAGTVDGGPGPLDDPPATLTFRLFDTYEAHLTPFRRVPVPVAAEEQDSSGAYVQQLTPSAEHAVRFYAALEDDPTLLDRADILTAEGESATLEWVGIYEFESNANDERPTVLMYGAAVAGGGITIRVRDAADVTLTAVLRENDADHPYERLWEYSNSSTEDVDFDLLECTTTDASPALLGAIVPVLFFRPDVAFQLAQSVDSIEGKLTVEYPAVEEDVGLAAEFADDLINHNALNTYVHDIVEPERRVHLNPWSENYPLPGATDATNPRRRHQFAFRYTWPDKSAAGTPKDYYEALYAQMGGERYLSFDVEHTYGTRIGFDEEHAQATHAGFPPAMPTRVTRSPASRTAKPAAGLEDVPDAMAGIESFVTVRLDPPSAGGGAESIVLEFRTDWLSDEAGESRPELHDAAWRAVTEMAHAESCSLHIVPWRFDLRSALAVDKASKLTMADALRNVAEELPDAMQSIDLQPRIGELYQQWRNGQLAGENQITVLLDDAGGWRLFEMCNIVEFELSVIRPQEAVPGLDSDGWTLLRSVPPASEQLAESEDRLPETRKQFRAWLGTLGQSRDAVIAAPAQRVVGDALQRVMGSGSGSARGSWIVPEGLQEISGTGIRAAACPVAFRPMANDPALGDDTYALIGRYLRVLDDLLAGDVPQWRDYAKPEWESHWGAVLAATRDDGGVRRMLAAAAALAVPIPRLDAAHGPVRELIGALRRDQDGLGEAFLAWLLGQLRQSPALYADAKAFLCTVVDGGSAGDAEALYSQYFRLRSTKTIREQQDGSLLVDRDLYTFRQTLRGDYQGLAQAEVLDDARYDNRFHFDQFSVETFEGALEAMRSNTGADAVELRTEPHVPLQTRQRVPLETLDLPAGAQRIDSDGNRVGEPVPVLLASRTPVSAPQHEWTGAIPAFQQDDELVVGGEFVEQDLVRGRLVPLDAAAPRESVVLVARSPRFRRSFRRDDFVLSTVFRIRGDEEAATSWTDAFANDAFHFRVLANAEPAPGPVNVANESVLKGLTKTLFETLRKTSETSELDDETLHSVLHHDVLDDVAAMLERPMTPARPVTDSHATVHIGEKRAGAEIDVTVANDGTVSSGIEALVFRVQPQRAGGEVRDPLIYLVFNVELPVWSRWAVALRQKRNMEDRDGVPGVDFAVEFGQVTESARDSSPFQPAVVEPIDDADRALPAPVVVRQREMDVTALIQRVLVDEGLVHASGTSGPRPWLKSDLSLTVSHRQLVRMPVAYRAGDSELVAKDAAEGIVVHDSAFPLRNFRWTAEQLQNARREQNVLFDLPYREFELEFQWTSPTNLPFLRIRRVDIVLRD